MADETPTRLEAFSAYTLSALTTLLWIGCVLPAGPLTHPELGGSDAAVPLHREALLLVPALLLLVLVPTGCTLARRFHGMRSVLAGTDCFVATYAAVALGITLWQLAGQHWSRLDLPSLIALLLMLTLGAMSGIEAWRQARGPARRPVPRVFAGARLALCLLVLIVPGHLLLHPNVERASLLAPFLFVAVSAGGAALSRGLRGLRRTAAVLQVLLAAHVFITLRYTMFGRDDPPVAPSIMGVELPGQITLALAAAVVTLAGIQVLLLLGGSDEGDALENEAASLQPDSAQNA
jgi:hypothetical protein